MPYNPLKAKDYWDTRFIREGRLWGDAPSDTATKARDLFTAGSVRTVFVPGSGYGRNSRVFSRAGFDVVAVEISGVACDLARTYDPHSKLLCGSCLELPHESKRYDAIYCFNLLHFFLEPERHLLVSRFLNLLEPNGLLYLVVFSEQESNYGKGTMVEKDTFETRPGRPAHYFTHDDLMAHLGGFNVMETALTHDREDHGEGPHTHVLRYAVARRPV